MFDNAAQYFSTLSEARSLMQGTYNGEDDATIDISSDNIIGIYNALGNRQEFLTSAIHGEIKSSLLAQLTAYASGTDDLAAQANSILSVLSARSAEVDVWVQAQMDSGYQKLTT